MVFLVERYKGHFYLKDILNSFWQSLQFPSVLYILSATPPLKYTLQMFVLRSSISGVKVMVSFPFLLLQYHLRDIDHQKHDDNNNRCGPVLHKARNICITNGSRKTVPSRILRMVPLGLFHICFRLNSLLFLIMSNGSAFNTYSMSLIAWLHNGHLSLVSSRAECPGQNILYHFPIRKDQFVFNKFPDDPGHFISIKFYLPGFLL